MSTADLPFLRTSERNKFGECVQAWWWAYREGLKPKAVKTGALWFGTGMHLALAEYYPAGTKRGVHPVETWETYCGATKAWLYDHPHGDPDNHEMVDAKELGTAMLTGYLRHWGDDEHWDVIQPEYPFSVLVGRPNPTLNYVGTFDGVYRDLRDDKIKLMEHKSRGKAITTKHLRLDNQAGGYWAVATHELREQGKIGPTETLHSITYNFLRKAMPDDRPLNTEGKATNKPVKANFVEALIGVDGWAEAELLKMKIDTLKDIAAAHRMQVLGEESKNQPAPLFVRHELRRTSGERRIQLQRIQDEGEHMAAVRRRELPVTKTPGDHCNYCDFVDMCELHEMDGDWRDYKKFAYNVEDPYADHRLGVERTSKFASMPGREKS